jgi:hypothetical protein
VEVVFRDQYVGRSDMWRLQLSLIGSPIYIQKPISFSCIRVRLLFLAVANVATRPLLLRA